MNKNLFTILLSQLSTYNAYNADNRIPHDCPKTFGIEKIFFPIVSHLQTLGVAGRKGRTMNSELFENHLPLLGPEFVRAETALISRLLLKLNLAPVCSRGFGRALILRRIKLGRPQF